MAAPKKSLDRFNEKWILGVGVNACWLWIGAHKDKRGGYGNFWGGDTTVYAHRWVYEYFRGPIPKGLQIDHLCRIRTCVNPLHLEIVTQRENIRRG